jgi:hypothetical protein
MNAMLESNRGRRSEPPLITTTLYDLMEAMQDELAFWRRAHYQRPFRPTLDGVSYS